MTELWVASPVIIIIIIIIIIIYDSFVALDPIKWILVLYN